MGEAASLGTVRINQFGEEMTATQYKKPKDLTRIPFAHLQADGEPVPWHGRVYMVGVGPALAGLPAFAFRSLGRPETRHDFGLVQAKGDAAHVWLWSNHLGTVVAAARVAARPVDRRFDSR